MTVIKYLPAEILGLSILASAALMRIILPEVSEFWLALASAVALFAIMQIRSYLTLDGGSEENSSP